MNETTRINWLNAWLGAVLAGVITLVVFVGTNMSGLPLPAGAGILLVGLALGIWWVFRRGERELALGAISGYAILSIISGGQCTLLVGESSDGLGALQGIVVYPLLLVAGLIVIGVVGFVRTRRDRKERAE